MPEPCDCPGCEEFRTVHARLCRELPAASRAFTRQVNLEAQWRYDDARAATEPLPVVA